MEAIPDEMEIDASEKELIRIGMAVMQGFTFRNFKKAAYSTTRHSVWVQLPDKDNEWYVEKHQGYGKDWDKDWVDALLDNVSEEAGIEF